MDDFRTQSFVWLFEVLKQRRGNLGGLMTMMRGTWARALTLIFVLASVTVPAAQSAAAGTSLPRLCRVIAFSPDFGRDGTGMCGHHVWKRFSAEDYRIIEWEMYETSDWGQGWHRIKPAGIGPFSDEDELTDIEFSPTYASDRTVYLESSQSILAMSTDGGRSFRRIHEGKADLQILTPARIERPSGETVGFVAADFDESLHLIAGGSKEDWPGAPGFDVWFLAPERSAPADDAFVIAYDETFRVPLQPFSTTPSLWRCRATFVCAEPLFRFPNGVFWERFSSAFLAPDYPEFKGLYFIEMVTSAEGEATMKAWRSQDGGTTIEEWDSVNEILEEVNQRGLFPYASIAVNKSFPERMFMHLTDYRYWSRRERIFRSDDRGSTWKLVAEGPDPEPSVGRIQWEGGILHQRISYISLQDDGSLFVLGFKDLGDTYYDGPFCSVDSGRHWSPLCRGRALG